MMNMNNMMISTLIFAIVTITTTVGQSCGPVNGIRINPDQYTDPFKYICCAAECGDMCGQQGCSIFGSEKCCGSYISRTCMVNGELLQGCVDEGYNEKPVTYCNSTNEAPCVLTSSDYQEYGYDREDEKKFSSNDDDNDLSTSEIVYICVGSFIFLSLLLACMVMGCRICHCGGSMRMVNREEQQQQQNNNDIELNVE